MFLIAESRMLKVIVLVKQPSICLKDLFFSSTSNAAFHVADCTFNTKTDNKILQRETNSECCSV